MDGEHSEELQRRAMEDLVGLVCSLYKVTRGAREIMMGVGNRVASVIMLTFPSEPCPHADFSK